MTGTCFGLATRAAAQAIPRWERLSSVPEARTEVAVATDGRSIYVLGGFIPPPANAPEGVRAGVSRTLLSYDPVSGVWSDAGQVPVATQHTGFVHVRGRLYLFGGYRDNSFEPQGDVWIFDPGAGAWTSGNPMPTPRGAFATAVLDGRIHVIGGTVADVNALDHAAHSVSGNDTSVGTQEVYDPTTDTWERRAPMPTPRNHHVAGAVNGRIYVTAGREGGTFTLTETEVYDPRTDSWSLAAPLPTGRSGAAGVVLANRLYIFGGETRGSGGNRTFDDAERFDAARGSWERLPPMPTARAGLGAVAVNGAIYVISGGPLPGYNFGTANERLVP